ncbi:MAG: FKBP-type peptidyl-prolyl cis-trans isomerase [Muribaculaceae bacterium]|nr:FKBP-type peptidyl-prolyl cis-trans isomerase [Muribaculaceae bacterium]
MNIKKYILPALMALLLAPWLTSCLGNDDDKYDYTAWKNENDTYFIRMQDTVGADGKKVFEKITPVWAPGVSILAQWHNDRSLTASNLVPMDNSTCDIVYQGSYYNGVVFDSSFYEVDSVRSFTPTSLIVGFWTMLTNMHVGDSVTCVIPQNAGYAATSSSIMPYSTLIFNIKLKAIKAYEVSGNTK